MSLALSCQAHELSKGRVERFRVIGRDGCLKGFVQLALLTLHLGFNGWWLPSHRMTWCEMAVKLTAFTRRDRLRLSVLRFWFFGTPSSRAVPLWACA